MVVVFTVKGIILPLTGCMPVALSVKKHICDNCKLTAAAQKNLHLMAHFELFIHTPYKIYSSFIFILISVSTQYDICNISKEPNTLLMLVLEARLSLQVDSAAF